MDTSIDSLVDFVPEPIRWFENTNWSQFMWSLVLPFFTLLFVLWVGKMEWLLQRKQKNKNKNKGQVKRRKYTKKISE